MTALADAKKQLEASFGKGILQRLGSKEIQKVPAISTGALTLDRALGVGGVARGRLIEIFGPESSGKTTLVYHILANAQAEGGQCAFIDTEHALDPVYAKALGVNTDELELSQPDYGEQALEVAKVLAETGEVSVIAVDSIDGCTPRSVLEGEMGESHVGQLARLMGDACRKLAPIANRTGTTIVFTNQLRALINTGGFGGPTETTSGGRAIKFYASQRLDIRRIETLKNSDGEAIANRCRVKVVKNKVAPPLRTAEFEIEYGKGVSYEGCLLDVALELGLAKKSGSWFSFGEQRMGQGRENAKAWLAGQPEAIEKIKESL